MFGADGVRGEINGDLTLENALRMGSAFAFMLGGEVPVVIGGLMGAFAAIEKSLTVGLLAGGLRCSI